MDEIESRIKAMQLIVEQSGDPRVCEVLMKEIRLLNIYLDFWRTQAALKRVCLDFGRWLFDDMK